MNAGATVASALVASAACAGNPGPWVTLRKALDWGLRAAAQGRVLPLPLLLDLAEDLADAQDRDPGLASALEPPGPGVVGYDNWVRSLGNLTRLFVGTRQEDLSLYQTELSSAEVERLSDPDRPPSGEPDYLPFLLWALHLPDDPTPPEEVVRAYRFLRSSQEHQTAVLEAWRGPRPPETDGRWEWWTRIQAAYHEDPTPAGLWSRFASEAGGEWLHERLDHVAGEIYLRDTAPDLTLDQSRRIDFLKQRRNEVFFTPMTTCYEELDPFQGAIALSTLCMGEYGMYKIANRSAVWISNPPATRPSHEVHVHLTWTCRYDGLRQEVDLALPGDPPQSLRPAAASILQGLAALLMDDWRCALRHLPVHFHLHRNGSTHEELNLGTGGPRWRNPEIQTYLPPAQVVAHLFKRNSLADLAGCEDHWTAPEGSADNTYHFWFGLILASDLRGLGFQEPLETGGLSGEWTGPSGRLPDCLSRLVVLTPGTGLFWNICDIRREVREGLSPRAACPEAHGEPHPYQALRRASLDVLLEALDRRMT